MGISVASRPAWPRHWSSALESHPVSDLGAVPCDRLDARAHSAGLVTHSWAAAAQCLSRTCTWTGDLGTESGLPRIAESLRSLLGEWVIHADANAHAVGGENDDDFPFDGPAADPEPPEPS